MENWGKRIMKYAEFVKAGEMKIIDKPMPKIEKMMM